MHKTEVKAFRVEFEKAVAKLEKKYGGKISLGTIRFDSDGLRSTMKFDKGVERIAAQDLNTLRIGDKVKINHRKAPGEWTITKVNRKTVMVEQDGRQVKASLSLLATVK